MRGIVTIIFALFLTAPLSQIYASGLPEGMMFLGLKNGEWQIHVVSAAGKLLTLNVPTEPRTASYSRQRKAVAYFAADGSLYETSLQNNKPRKLLESDNNSAFTQPSYSSKGDQLFMVELKGGTSAETMIQSIDPDKIGLIKRISNQPGAQFEPRSFGDSRLLYSSVSCTIGCGHIIQEIWLKNLVTNETRQVSLSNAIARQPVGSVDGKWIYFSSNLAGNYHIWRVPTTGGAAERITEGNVTDVSPAVAERGDIYFVRYGPNGPQLMKLDRDKVLSSVPLPNAITDIRNLEISQ